MSEEKKEEVKEVKEEEKTEETPEVPEEEILKKAIKVPKEIPRVVGGYIFVATLLIVGSILMLSGFETASWIVASGVALLVLCGVKMYQGHDVIEISIAGIILLIGGLGEIYNAGWLVWLLAIGIGFLILGLVSLKKA